MTIVLLGNYNINQLTNKKVCSNSYSGDVTLNLVNLEEGPVVWRCYAKVQQVWPQHQQGRDVRSIVPVPRLALT